MQRRKTDSELIAEVLAGFVGGGGSPVKTCCEFERGISPPNAVRHDTASSSTSDCLGRTTSHDGGRALRGGCEGPNETLGTEPHIISVRANAPNVPRVLSDNPYDPDFVFERTIQEPPPFSISEPDSERENDIFDSLGDDLGIELQNLLDQRRRDIRRDYAVRSGRDWDPRPDLAVFAYGGNVWRMKDPRPPMLDDVLADDPPSQRHLGRLQINELISPFRAERNGVNLHELGFSVSPSGYIVNGDSRELISHATGYDMRSFPWRCIALTTPIFGAGGYGSGSGSGSKIYDRVVLTCAHIAAEGRSEIIFPGNDGIAHSLELVPSADPNGSFASVLSVGHPKYVDHKWRWWDVGVTILPNCMQSKALGNFGVSSNLGLQSKPVWSYGYPVVGKCAAAEALDGNPGCRFSMFGMKGAINVVLTHQLSTNIDVQPGQSGSPLWRYINDGEIYVVGVIRGGGLLGSISNRAVRIEKHKHHWLRGFRDKFPISVPEALCPPDSKLP